MPYFKWSGIDITGRIHKGHLFARTQPELDALLFKQGIALLTSAPKRNLQFARSIPVQIKIEFFKPMADMLASGILLPEALMIINSQLAHAQFQDIITHLSHELQEGKSLSQGLARYPKVFDSIIIHMVAAGEESGKLPIALNLLGEYLSMVADFKKRLWQAALIPLCTFVFFCVMSIAIFIFVVPQFIDMFNSVSQELPWVTTLMIEISDMVRSSLGVTTLAGGAIIAYLVYAWTKTKRGKEAFDSLIIKVPILGKAIKEASLAYYLQALAMLTQGGTQLVPSLKISQHIVNSTAIRNKLNFIEQEVESGSSLSQAMIANPDQIFSAEIIAIIRAGEESGRFVPLLSRASGIYQERVKRTIALFTVIINPLLMLILGLLIAMLIFAIYLPIFNLSNVIK